MLKVVTSSACLEEKKYIFDQLFSEFLGLEFTLEIDEKIEHFELSNNTKIIVIKDYFFQRIYKNYWLSNETLPDLPLMILAKELLSPFNLYNHNDLPILYGDEQLLVSENEIKLGLDVFGSCFFLLSRYEELVINKRDNHGRFPVESSIAFKSGILKRPIVDEYVILLWNCIKHLWPELKRKAQKSTTYLSCDVDYIKDYGVHFPGIIKRLGADILKRKSIKSFYGSIMLFWNVSVLGKNELDPFNTFDFMMDECEKNNLKMAFYFIPKNNKKAIDGNYNIESEKVIGLMKRIIKRRHEVGFHASYYSYKDLSKTVEEVNLLRRVYNKAGGDPNDIIGGRQHFLRWETGITEKNWEAAGLEYDSTLGFADHIGFRCGTSYEYNFYDLVNRVPLKLKCRPLVVMEVSMLSENYMNLNHSEALNSVLNIKREVEVVAGNFTILWHNSSLNSLSKKKLFKNILQQI